VVFPVKDGCVGLCLHVVLNLPHTGTREAK
jgi:hypothetical protein